MGAERPGDRSTPPRLSPPRLATTCRVTDQSPALTCRPRHDRRGSAHSAGTRPTGRCHDVPRQPAMPRFGLAKSRSASTGHASPCRPRQAELGTAEPCRYVPGLAESRRPCFAEPGRAVPERAKQNAVGLAQPRQKTLRRATRCLARPASPRRETTCLELRGPARPSVDVPGTAGLAPPRLTEPCNAVHSKNRTGLAARCSAGRTPTCNAIE